MLMSHTTFIPYQKFENVLGVVGIDEYIRHGGTMSLGGKRWMNRNVRIRNLDMVQLLGNM